METLQQEKKPFSRKSENTIHAQVALPEELVQWGEAQSGGLSDLVERLLREAREQAADEEDNAKWDASFAATPDDKLLKMAEKVRADYAAGKTRPGGFGSE